MLFVLPGLTHLGAFSSFQQDKLFFGTRIEVNPACKSLELEEPITVRSPTITNSRSETELDEFHPRATRTLFVGNLDKDISKTELTNKFSQFGEILVCSIRQGYLSSI